MAANALRIANLTPNSKVVLDLAGEQEEATFVRLTGEGDDMQAVFITHEDGDDVEWTAYRYKGRWAFGSSAKRLSVLRVVPSGPTHLGSNGDQHAGTFSTCQPCTQASADALRQCTGSVSTTVTNIDVATGTVESQATSGPSPEVVSAAVRALAEDFRAAGAEVTVHPQHRYNPRTDPARVDEATVRRAVGIGVWMRGVGVILQQGTFVPGGDGLYGAVYVLVKRSGMPEERAYSTHRAIVRSEDGQPLSVSADIGHYDMSRDKAEWDLAGRVG